MWCDVPTNPQEDSKCVVSKDKCCAPHKFGTSKLYLFPIKKPEGAKDVIYIIFVV